MKFGLLKKLLIFTATITLLLLASGCSKQNQKTQEKTSEKPPEVLGKMETNIDAIIDLLDKEGKIEEGTSGQKTQEKREASNTSSSSQSSQKDQGSSQGGQSGQSSQSGSGQQGQQQQQQQPAQTNPWDQSDKIIKQIHMQWSQFQPEAQKVGVSSQIMDSFSTDLNALTNDIAVKNLITTLNDTNNLYKYLPEFMSHYKDKSADLKRLKYYARDVMYKSRFDKWSDASASASSAKNLIPNLRSQQNEENKKKYQSLEYSVYELEKVVKEKQKSLTQIKANVVLNNIKEIEKSSKESEDKSQAQ